MEPILNAVDRDRWWRICVVILLAVAFYGAPTLSHVLGLM